MKILCVLLGGALGAVCRYGVSTAAARLYGDGFPWGTLAVNLAGCFLIGLAFALGVERELLPPSFRLFFVTGFLGALTTFSTYTLESLNFARDGLTTAAVLNLLANNVFGLPLCLAGMWLGRLP